MQPFLQWIAGLLVITAFVPYGLAIHRKQTVPMKASWLIWLVLDSVTFAGMYAADAVNGQILGAVVGGWIIVFLAFKHGEAGWTKLDKFCLAGAALGIALWQIFDNPLLGITTSLSVLFLGAIPTFVSAWKDPRRENKAGWVIFWLSCVFTTAAIPEWTFADVAQPIVFLLINSTMMFILFRPRKG